MQNEALTETQVLSVPSTNEHGRKLGGADNFNPVK